MVNVYFKHWAQAGHIGHSTILLPLYAGPSFQSLSYLRVLIHIGCFHRWGPDSSAWNALLLYEAFPDLLGMHSQLSEILWLFGYVSGGTGPFLPHVKAVWSYTLGCVRLAFACSQAPALHVPLISVKCIIYFVEVLVICWCRVDRESWVLDEALSLTSLANFLISLFSQPSNGNNYALFFQAWDTSVTSIGLVFTYLTVIYCYFGWLQIAI